MPLIPIPAKGGYQSVTRDWLVQLHRPATLGTDPYIALDDLLDANNLEVAADALGTGTVERTLAEILSQYPLTPTLYGCAADGVTDDTTALQALIDTTTAQEVIALRPGKTYLTGNLTLKNYTKLNLNGATLKAAPGTTAVLTFPAQASVQNDQQCVVWGGNINGNSVSNVYGILTGNHASLTLYNVGVRNCYVGFGLTHAQFNSAYSCKAQGCTVGWYLKQHSSSGGANSWTFVHCASTSNTVGLIVSKTSSQPSHSNRFYNFVATGNSVAQIALFGTDDIVFDGLSNESCGTSTASVSFDSLTIYNSSVYMYGATATFASPYVSEASVNPCFLLENASRLLITGSPKGYGVSNGSFIKRSDAASYAFIGGGHGAVGNSDVPLGFAGPILGTVGILTVPASTWATSSIPNEASSPYQTEVNATGATASNATDTLFGAVRQCVFAASTGGSSSNRLRFDFNCAGAIRIHAVSIMSSVDGWFQTGYAGNISNRDFYLKAGVWTRLIYLTSSVSTGSQTMYIYPKDSVGATVQFTRWQVASGAEGPRLRAIMAAMAAGAYNPLITALTENSGSIGGTNDGNLPDLSSVSASPTQAEVTAIRDAVRELATKINLLQRA